MLRRQPANQKKLLMFVATAIGLVLPLAVAPAVHAADGRFYLSPDKVTVEKNQTFTLQLRLDTGGNTINYTEPVIKWPLNTLEYDGQSGYLQSDLNTGGCPDGLVGGYTATAFCREKAGGINGDVLIGTVTFKALIDNGTINVELDDHQSSAGYSGYVDTKDNNDSRYTPLKFSGSSATISFTPDPKEPKQADLSNRKENGELPSDTAVVTAPASAPTPAIAEVKDTTDNKQDEKQPGNNEDKPTQTITARPASDKTYVWLSFGLLLVVAAGVGLFIMLYRRRNVKTDANKKAPLSSAKPKRSTMEGTSKSAKGK